MPIAFLAARHAGLRAAHSACPTPDPLAHPALTDPPDRGRRDRRADGRRAEDRPAARLAALVVDLAAAGDRDAADHRRGRAARLVVGRAWCRPPRCCWAPRSRRPTRCSPPTCRSASRPTRRTRRTRCGSRSPRRPGSTTGWRSRSSTRRSRWRCTAAAPSGWIGRVARRGRALQGRRRGRRRAAHRQAAGQAVLPGPLGDAAAGPALRGLPGAGRDVPGVRPGRGGRRVRVPGGVRRRPGDPVGRALARLPPGAARLRRADRAAADRTAAAALRRRRGQRAARRR